MLNLRYPNITGSNPTEQMAQMRSYLHQLVDQLQWAMGNIETNNTSSVVVSSPATPKSAEAPKQTLDAKAAFDAVKPYIIKSADIVSAYYDEIGERLSGEYLAISDFGTFQAQTTQDIISTSTNIEHIFTNIQKIESDIDTNFKELDVRANINWGIVDEKNGVPVYGLEIGQRNTIDDEEVFNKYARFTADRLSFYDQNDAEIAYISDYKLYITHAEVTGTLQLGGYLVDTTNGLAFKWVGRG